VGPVIDVEKLPLEIGRVVAILRVTLGSSYLGKGRKMPNNLSVVLVHGGFVDG